MDAESGEGEALCRTEWRRLVERGLLGTKPPEELFRACRALNPATNQRLLGELMAALAEAAARFLRRRVSVSHPNGGTDVIHATIGKMQDAILQPGHADAEGYSVMFFGKLDLRLMDQLRRSRSGLAGNGQSNWTMTDRNSTSRTSRWQRPSRQWQSTSCFAT